jgi:hypothetical protein
MLHGCGVPALGIGGLQSPRRMLHGCGVPALGIGGLQSPLTRARRRWRSRTRDGYLVLACSADSPSLTRAHRLRPSRRALGLVGVLACSADSPSPTRAHRLRPSQRALGLVGVLACSADSPSPTRAHRLRPSRRALGLVGVLALATSGSSSRAQRRQLPSRRAGRQWLPPPAPLWHGARQSSRRNSISWWFRGESERYLSGRERLTGG